MSTWGEKNKLGCSCGACIRARQRRAELANLSAPPSFLLWLLIALANCALGRIDLLHPLLHLTETLSAGTVSPHARAWKNKVPPAYFALALGQLSWLVGLVSLLGQLYRGFIVVRRDVAAAQDAREIRTARKGRLMDTRVCLKSAWYHEMSRLGPWLTGRQIHEFGYQCALASSQP